MMKTKRFCTVRIRRSVRGCLASLLVAVILLCPGAGTALTAEEIVALKKAGVDNETIRLISVKEDGGVAELEGEEGNAVIYYSTGRSAGEDKKAVEREKFEKALRMLENIRIDTRP